MNLNAIKPVGPHIEGVIRFASEGRGEDLVQHDYFEVLARVHDGTKPEGTPKLAPHPIGDELRTLQANAAEGRIRVIPIRLMFNDPGLSLSARYEAYDADLNRLACAGDGTKGCRANFAAGTSQDVACVGPDACEYANAAGVHCALHVKLKAQIEGQADAFSVFELQSGGINTYRTISAKLSMMHAAFGKRLRHVPLEIGVYAKSGAASDYRPFYVADVKLRQGTDVKTAIQAALAGERDDKGEGLALEEMEAAVAQMAAGASLSLDDAESALISFAPGVVDRSRLKRAAPNAVQAASSVNSIADIVAVARTKQHEQPAAAEVPPEQARTLAASKPITIAHGMSTAPSEKGAACVAAVSGKIAGLHVSRELPPFDF